MDKGTQKRQKAPFISSGLNSQLAGFHIFVLFCFVLHKSLISLQIHHTANTLALIHVFTYLPYLNFSFLVCFAFFSLIWLLFFRFCSHSTTVGHTPQLCFCLFSPLFSNRIQMIYQNSKNPFAFSNTNLICSLCLLFEIDLCFC